LNGIYELVMCRCIVETRCSWSLMLKRTVCSRERPRSVVPSR
jgi:hypothetical protein